MNLYDICRMVAVIEEDLYCNRIDYSCDDLKCAMMRPGHPSDVLDEILSIVGWEVFQGITPEREKIENFYIKLKEFKACLKIKELKKPIDALDEYLYPRITVTFPIYIEDGGESFVEYAVTEKELQKIKTAIDEGYDFEEANGLKGLYNKIMRAAKRKIKEDIDLTFDDIDYDELEYSIDYPENLEDTSNE